MQRKILLSEILDLNNFMELNLLSIAVSLYFPKIQENIHM